MKRWITLFLLLFVLAGTPESAIAETLTLSGQTSSFSEFVKSHQDLSLADLTAAFSLASRAGISPDIVLLMKQGKDWTQAENDLSKLNTARNYLVSSKKENFKEFADVLVEIYGFNVKNIKALKKLSLSNADILELVHWAYISGVPLDQAVTEVEQQLAEGGSLEFPWPDFVTESGITKKDPKSSSSPVIQDLAATATTGVAAAAATTTSLIDPRGIYNSDVVAPFNSYFAGKTELISPESGALIFSQTDMVLPGRNGFDLAITRVYSSNAANCYNMDSSSRTEQWVQSHSGSRWIPDESFGPPIYTPPDLEKGTLGFYYEVYIQGHYETYWADQQNVGAGIISGTVYAHNHVVVERFTYENKSVAENTSNEYSGDYPIFITSGETAFSDSLFLYGYVKYWFTTFPREATYLDRRYAMGTGWGLKFPSIELYDSTKYLHLGDGSVFLVDFTNTASHLKNYPLKDMIFNTDAGSFSNGQVSSAYRLNLKDGTVYFFASDGRLLGYQNRNGDTIKMEHISRNGVNVISAIIDSVGRRVTFTYTAAQVIVSCEGRTVEYNLESVATGKYKLASVKDTGGRLTSYEYQKSQGLFEFSIYPPSAWDEVYSNGPAVNYYLNLIAVNHPTGAQTKYTYELTHKNIEQSDPSVVTLSYMEYFRAKTRSDLADGRIFNLNTFVYSPYNTTTKTYSTVRTESKGDWDPANTEGITETYVFNGTHMWIEREVRGSGIHIKTVRTYNYDNKTPFTDTTYYYDANGNYREVKTDYIYDNNNFADLLRQSDSTGRLTEWTYDSKFHQVTAQNKKVDGSLYEQSKFILDAKGNEVEETKVLSQYTSVYRPSWTEGPTSGNLKPAPKEWVWRPDKPVDKIELWVYWFAAAPWEYAKYTVWYRPQTPNAAWIKVASGGSQASLFASKWATNHIIIPVPNGAYEVKVRGERVGAFGCQVIVTKSGYWQNYVMDFVPQPTTLKNTYTYDTAYPSNVLEKKVWMEDGTTQSTTFTYDSTYHAYPVSQTTNVTDPMSGTKAPVTVQYAYDAWGNKTAFIDGENKRWDYTYDALNRLTGEVLPSTNGETVNKQYSYLDAENKVEITEPEGNIILYAYDPLGRLTSVYRRASGMDLSLLEIGYDSLGRKVSETDANGHSTLCEYDAGGRLIKTVTPDGTVKTASYDDYTMTLTTLDGNQNKTRTVFDAAGNKVEVQEWPDPLDPTGYITRFNYDLQGRMVGTYKGLAAGVGDLTKYTKIVYGVTGKLERLEYPGTNLIAPTAFSYDNRGNLKAKNNVTYAYDELGRLVKIQPQNGVSSTIRYDKAGNKVEVVSSDGQSTVYGYDALNRVISVKTVINGISYTLGYSYDRNGNLKALTYPDGSVVTYEYDELNRLMAIPGFAGTRDNPGLLYDNTGFLTTLKYNNGVATTYSYDTRDRIAGISSPVLNLAYTLDNNGNILQINDRRFTYDGLNRLTSFQMGSGETVTYGYDPMGNRLSVNGTQVATYDEANRLLTLNGLPVTYDTWGNMTGKPGYTFTYDVEDRMVTAAKDGVQLQTNVYDAEGRRVKVTNNGISIVTVYNGNQPIYEVTGAQITKYVYAGNLLIAKLQDGTLSFVHNDHLGSPRIFTDPNGQIVGTVDYEPFGKPLETTGLTESGARFTGKPQDSTTNLYYFGARFYDPEIGRFLSLDPGKEGLNWYTYCHNNPLTMMDPDGELPVLYLAYMYAAALTSSPDTYMDIQMLAMDMANGDYLGAGLDVVSMALPGVTNLSAGARVVRNAAKGRAFEEQGIKLLNKLLGAGGKIVKNTQKIDGRIADVLFKTVDGKIAGIVEFKNYSGTLYSSDQLRTFIKQAGSNFVLVVSDTTTISSKLYNQIQEVGGHIVRIVDGKFVEVL